MTEKKVVGSKNDFSKSCLKFCKVGDDFVLFWQNLKNEDSIAKNASFEENKIKWDKRVIRSKEKKVFYTYIPGYRAFPPCQNLTFIKPDPV